MAVGFANSCVDQLNAAIRGGDREAFDTAFGRTYGQLILDKVRLYSYRYNNIIALAS